MLFLLTILAFSLGAIGGLLTENCLTWSVRQCLVYGGKLICRPSTFADDTLPPKYRSGVGYWLAKRVPHFLWKTNEGVIMQYTVTPEGRQAEAQGKQTLFAAWLRIWFYKGHVIAGDNHGGPYRVICERGTT